MPDHRSAPSSSPSRGASLRRSAIQPSLLLLGTLSASLSLSATDAQAFTLTAPDAYRNVLGSSAFGTGFEPTNLFDDDLATAWALGGANGANPQGRDEGWISFETDRDFIVNRLTFAPRGPSGDVDGVDRLMLWASMSPFDVDVTNASSTAAFLASNLQPSFQKAGFAATSSLPYSYKTGSLVSRYFLVRLLNETDTRSSRNLGARSLGLLGTPLVPGPLPVLGVASAFVTSRRLRRRCRLG